MLWRLRIQERPRTPSVCSSTCSGADQQWLQLFRNRLDALDEAPPEPFRDEQVAEPLRRDAQEVGHRPAESVH